VVVVRDLEASLRFYRDGIGLDLLQDWHVEGDWPDLFDAPSRRVRAVFLGDAAVPDDHAGVLELKTRRLGTRRNAHARLSRAAVPDGLPGRRARHRRTARRQLAAALPWRLLRRLPRP
jgi:catechol 2,3-dioxygenase-like lactoylglutathione lyase family enzyme